MADSATSISPTANNQSQIERKSLGLLSPALVRSGYRPKNESIHRAVNFIAASILMLLALPFFTVIWLAVRLTQRGDVFYAGPRIGQNGEIFNIYKFRTLDTEKARELTKDKVLPKNSNAETKLGKILRDSRMDELPQLWNVIKGDMNLVGPRPVRPELAEGLRGGIKNYDVRFQVRPGLLGYTQVYMAHAASKKYRSRYNRMLCASDVSYVEQLKFIFHIATVSAVKMTSLVVQKLWRKASKLTDKTYRDERKHRRWRNAHIELSTGGRLGVVSLIDDDHIVVSGIEKALDGKEISFELKRPVSRRRIVSTRCSGTIVRSWVDGNAVYRNEIRYKPQSDVSEYMLDRYFLRNVIATGR